jgi:hypothetical protein
MNWSSILWASERIASTSSRFVTSAQAENFIQRSCNVTNAVEIIISREDANSGMPGENGQTSGVRSIGKDPSMAENT